MNTSKAQKKQKIANTNFLKKKKKNSKKEKNGINFPRLLKLEDSIREVSV